ncbi:MAG TPA: ABC transporter ATP-binding protein [Burkholderiales bacterium]|nr:ABC transporter ATP-binding protein [Burkholderiales bacterium]
MTQDTRLLEIENVSKRFGGLAALTEVSLSIEMGEIYALIGPNGAGKTTLFNVITGIYRPDKGSFRMDGLEMAGKKPNRMAKSGIARTFQNIRLFSNMTALENVMVGRHCRSESGILGAIFRSRKARTEELSIAKKAMHLLDYTGIGKHAHMLAKNLSYGDQRRLEIARALATEPRLLALDEPAAGMNHSETDSLKELLQRIRADGVTILLIEHDMKLVMNLCDRLAVLNFGKKIAEGKPSEVGSNPLVVEAYLGGS